MTSRLLHVLVGALLAIFALTSCTNDSTETAASGPTASQTPTVPAGIQLSGWPTDAFGCQYVDGSRPGTKPIHFDTVTGLLICVNDRETKTFSLLPTDHGFNKVMTALTEKDDKGIAYCPMIPSQSHPATIGVVANTPQGAYLVRTPYGLCGWVQPELSRALESAGVKVSPNPLGLDPNR